MISNAENIRVHTAGTESFERVIDLCRDDLPRRVGTAVRDAIKAATWELGASYGHRGKTCRRGGTLISEAVKDYLGRICAVLPDCKVIADGGSGRERIALSGALSRETDIAAPIPLNREVLCAIKDYYISPRFFTPEDPTEAPTPRDISGDPPEALYLPLVSDPTGVALSWAGLCEWVDYAVKNRVLLICDATLSVFCGAVEWRHRFPESIYCIPSASECAVEVASLSPSFRAGIGCGYRVIPSSLRVNEKCLCAIGERLSGEGDGGSGDLFAYVTERGAAASLSEEGMCDSHRMARSYIQNARRICALLVEKGFECATVGASPYVFGRFPDVGDRYPTVDAHYIRKRSGIALPCGEDFGLSSEGYLRFSAILSQDEAAEVISKIDLL